ncbi:DUF72 domain-containing protein [Segeticoccus rhizosphaerae]|jgi:uncharacterized protein YecE (DUF72 family)|uniref:DUF72 domain-containing protein n=1 Tax=Segeticoccus rhizosphaerae TaxID=1104777 RepID=UPI001264DC88|nr:DUF72 domain-containing protein [Segeticoccus rhizosphaerae]
MGEVRVGISGWRYRGWRGTFYPPGLVQRLELAYASERLRAIEINGSFYSLQRPSSYTTWRQQVPPGFLFAVKGGRFITHMKKLGGVETALANFFASGVLALGPTLGPVLWQLPPNLGFDASRFQAFFDLLPRSTAAAAVLAGRHDDKLSDDRVLAATDEDRPIRHVLEVRHDSLATPAAMNLLERNQIGIVVADTAGRWPRIEQATSDLVYIRLHGAEELYVSGYTDAALDDWAAKVRRWVDSGHDVHVYFDNDAKVHAPFDAIALADRLGLPSGSRGLGAQ